MLLGQALEAPENNPDLYYNVALAYLSLEMIEQAANSLSQALDVGLPLIVAQSDPLFDLLRESGALGNLLTSKLSR